MFQHCISKKKKFHDQCVVYKKAVDNISTNAASA